jgi:hypothetical protein
MNGIRVVLFGCIAASLLSLGCTRKVTLNPENAASHNQRDWTIQQVPANVAAPTSAAPPLAAPAR